jgi:hypothetical protein
MRGRSQNRKNIKLRTVSYKLPLDSTSAFAVLSAYTGKEVDPADEK